MTSESEPPSQAPETLDIRLKTPDSTNHRRTGKIARLPKETRDKLNHMIEDGLPYAQIIKKLGKAGKSLSEDCLKRWRQGGYQDWLKHQTWLELSTAKLHFAMDVLQQPDGDAIHPASLRMAVTQMLDLVSRFDPAVLEEKIASNPDSYSRIINALARLNEASLKFETLRFKQTGSAADNSWLSKFAPPAGKRALTPDTLEQIERELNL